MKSVSEMLKDKASSVTTDEPEQNDAPVESDAPAADSVAEVKQTAKADEPKGETAQAPPPDAKHDEVTGLKALEAERRKRQEAERLAAQGQTRQEAPKAPDVIQDPEGFQKHIQGQFRQETIDRTISLSDDFARDRYADYTEVMGTDESGQHTAWIEPVSQNPHLIDQFIASPNPAKFAYEQVKRSRVMNDIGDPLTYRERIEAEVRARLEKELAAKVKLAPDIPDTLADEPSKSSRKGPEWTGPKPIKDILNRKRA